MIKILISHANSTQLAAFKKDELNLIRLEGQLANDGDTTKATYIVDEYDEVIVLMKYEYNATEKSSILHYEVNAILNNLHYSDDVFTQYNDEASYSFILGDETAISEIEN